MLGVLLVGGCAGYRLGPVSGDAPGARSILVLPFVNETLEPRLSEALVTALRRELQRDGTFRLARRDEADVVLSGVIMRYQRRELTLEPRDVATPRDLRVNLTVRVTARERGTGRVILDREVTDYTLLPAAPDLAGAERQALPTLADGLARQITALLTEGGW